MQLLAAFLVSLAPLAGFGATASSSQEITTQPMVDAKASAASKVLASTHRVATEHVTPASPDATSTFSQMLEWSRKIESTQTVPLASYAGHTFTNQELSSTLALRMPTRVQSMSAQEVYNSPELLRDVVRDLVYERLLFEKAKEQGVNEQTTGIKEQLEKFRANALQKLFYEKTVRQAINQLDEKSARQYYEDHKKELYTQPESLAVQDLHLSGYKPYVVKPGDTFEAIARAQSGDPEASKQFLRSNALHFPRLPSSRFGNEAPLRAPQPGEKILVPLNKEEMASKAQLAKRLRDQASQGEDFTQLITRYADESDVPTSATPFIPEIQGMLPEIRTAIDQARSTSVSQVLRTPYGFDIIKLADYQPTRTLSFDEVRSQIKVDGEQLRKNSDQASRETVEKLADKHKLKIHTDVLQRADYRGDNPLTADTPIASAPGFTYTLDQFLKDMLPTMKGWPTLGYEGRLNLAKSSPTVVGMLIRREAEAQGLDKTPDFQALMESKAIIEITTEYMRRQQQQKGEPDDTELRQYYTQHLDRYTSPGMVTVRELTKRVSLSLPTERRLAAIENTKKDLSQLRSQVHSLADFENLARRESEAISTRSRGGLLGTVPVGFRGDFFKARIEKLKPGEVSEPFLYGQEVMIIRLDARTEPTVVPFEEVLGRVRSDYLREMPKKRMEADRDQLLAKAGFKLLF